MLHLKRFKSITCLYDLSSCTAVWKAFNITVFNSMCMYFGPVSGCCPNLWSSLQDCSILHLTQINRTVQYVLVSYIAKLSVTDLAGVSGRQVWKWSTVEWHACFYDMFWRLLYWRSLCKTFGSTIFNRMWAVLGSNFRLLFSSGISIQPCQTMYILSQNGMCIGYWLPEGGSSVFENLVVHQLTNKLPDFMEPEDLTPHSQCSITRPLLK